MMALSRRDLFKGAGAFVGAATAYKASEAGVLLPYDKIITAPVPPWAGDTMVLAFEGVINSFSLNGNMDSPVFTSIEGRIINKPIVESYDFSMEFNENNISDIALRHGIYVQIFQKVSPTNLKQIGR